MPAALTEVSQRLRRAADLIRDPEEKPITPLYRDKGTQTDFSISVQPCLITSWRLSHSRRSLLFLIVCAREASTLESRCSAAISWHRWHEAGTGWHGRGLCIACACILFGECDRQRVRSRIGQRPSRHIFADLHCAMWHFQRAPSLLVRAQALTQRSVFFQIVNSFFQDVLSGPPRMPGPGLGRVWRADVCSAAYALLCVFLSPLGVSENLS